MKIYKLSKHGSILTGRDYGKSVMQEIKPVLTKGMSLDFNGVSSLGSSFGDEVVTPIAVFNGGSVDVYNVNYAIKTALQDIAEDGDIVINYM